MLLFPNAKINLGLRILEKRFDGFHSIETVFLPLNLTEVLEFIEEGKNSTTLTVTGIALEGDNEENLVVKAWHIMNEKFKIPPLSIHLHKTIPVGAGLGGGSADAAFMLKGLNEYFKCGCTHMELKIIAAELGSDCAFFIDNAPMLGTGRGEVLESLDIALHGYEILLIKPDIHIATREAYSGIVPAIPEKPLKKLLKGPIKEWQETIINDFELSVFKKYPEIELLKNKLLNMGARYAAMSGSGSAVYGIFEAEIPVENFQDFKNCFVYKGRILQ